MMRLASVRAAFYAILFVCLGALCLTALSGPGLAQGAPVVSGNGTPDYDTWETVASRAEASVERATATDDVLEALREQVVAWREEFLVAQGANSARIATLREQIDALGAAPAEGESEAPEIESRRQDLSVQLSDALAPVRRAQEATSRADGIIRQIDTLIRSRQADALLSFGPSPLNPVLYPQAFTDIGSSAADLVAETQTKLNSDASRQTARENLPRVGLYLLVALALLIRGRATMERLTQTVMERFSGRAVRLAAFVTSLFQVLVPLVGIFLLVEAAQLTGLLGTLGNRLIGVLPMVGLCFFLARWLSLRLAPLHPNAPRPLPGPPERGWEIRLHITWVGALIGLLLFLDELASAERYEATTQAVLYFPVFFFIGLTYVRVGRLLSRFANEAADLGDTATFAQRGEKIVGKALVILGMVAPLLAAVGYMNLAYFLTVPTAMTLGLLGVLRVLHDIVIEIFAVAMRKTTDEAKEALLPSLISFALVLVSVPVFALIWGARVADITEIWARVREGFAIGDTVISPGSFLVFAIVFGALYVGTRLLQTALQTSVLPKTGMDQGAQTAVISGVGYLGIILAAVIAVTTAGINLAGLALVAGALSVGIGFGLQNIVSNFISGIILLIERPVAEGDWIEVGGHMGIVKDISVRSTVIETFDKNSVIVPNADFISGAVKNWTRGNVTGRIVIPVGVAYGSDTRKVEQILREITMDHPLVSLTPEPGVDFLDFGASSLDFQIRAILPDIGQGMAVRTEIRHQIVERFAQEGIEMPFPQTDLWIKNPEALLGQVLQTPKPSAPPEEPSSPSDEPQTR